MQYVYFTNIFLILYYFKNLPSVFIFQIFFLFYIIFKTYPLCLFFKYLVLNYYKCVLNLFFSDVFCSLYD